MNQRRSARARARAMFVQAARDLRQRETCAEDMLWDALRNRRLAGAKFRRQHPIEHTPYIADFLCYESHLVIELDGGIHATQAEDDANRQGLIESFGYRVLRFPNEQVFQHLDSVLVTICQALQDATE